MAKFHPEESTRVAIPVEPQQGTDHTEPVRLLFDPVCDYISSREFQKFLGLTCDQYLSGINTGVISQSFKLSSIFINSFRAHNFFDLVQYCLWRSLATFIIDESIHLQTAHRLTDEIADFLDYQPDGIINWCELERSILEPPSELEESHSNCPDEDRYSNLSIRHSLQSVKRLFERANAFVLASSSNSCVSGNWSSPGFVDGYGLTDSSPSVAVLS